MVTSVIALSLVTTLIGIKRSELRWADTIADTVTAETVALRGFVARVGGVYAAPQGDLAPNPYLEHPLRDVRTLEGADLTLINPAFMTRLVNEELSRRSGIEVRLLSTTPRNPDNMAPPEVARVLADLAPSARGVGGLAEVDGVESYRHVSPVEIEHRCVQCHPSWATREGELAGAITVTFDWAPFAAEGHQQMAAAVVVHALVLATVLLLLLRFGRALGARAEELRVAGHRIESLEGLIKICSVCSRVRRRDDAPHDPASWQRVETYISEATDADWSHGLCPDCYCDMAHRVAG